MMMQNTMANRN